MRESSENPDRREPPFFAIFPFLIITFGRA